MISKDFKAWAREMLSGKWTSAVIICLLADIISWGVSLAEEFPTNSTVDWVAMAVSFVLSMLIGGVVSLGIAHYFTNLATRREAQIADLFAFFRYIGKAIWMSLVVSCYVFLWSLLFVIPGIIAMYRYAMVPYLIAEFPDLSVSEAMDESARLMQGNKMRLFCLQFSFIGWIFLSVLLTFGIGLLWVTPYMQAADAAFYLEVTGRGGMRSQPSAEL